MNIKIPQEICTAIGLKKLNAWGGLDLATDRSFNYHKFAEVNLEWKGVKRVRDLLEMLRPHEKLRGGQVLVRDVTRWLSALEGEPGDVKPRSVEQFCALLKKFLAAAPQHHLYQHDESRGVLLCHYVEEIEYTPPRQSSRGEKHPQYTTIELAYREMGRVKKERVHFYASDCLGQNVRASLIKKGYVPETPDLRAAYEAEVACFNAAYEQIGKQYHAIGTATDDLDGNEKQNRSGWWWRHTNKIRLDRDGAPSRVVVDVFKEEDQEDSEHDAHVNVWFWKKGRTETDSDDDTDDPPDLYEEDPPDLYEEDPQVEIPLHPMVACFDMKRHTRLRIHITQMTEYVYNRRLGDSLVLPKESRQLIEILLERSSDFKDIIGKKGGGAVILCAGPPGCGKTLTAEVFAEVEGRPLYTVQASQLGTNEEGLEDELLKVFARATRWNAILLIDEVDVYAHERGQDLRQNAIVGVVLRVLEYFQGVLFMTTNRGDLVDDAIASRCTALINYTVPSNADQKRLWRILADTAGVQIRDEVIETIARMHPNLSGRDVKQLLKLGSMVAAARGEPEVLASTITFVKRFKPTKHDDPKTEADV